MFFIQNSEGTVVAADKEFLDAAGFESLLLLAEHFRSEHLKPDPKTGELILGDQPVSLAVTEVQTLWGEGTLYQATPVADTDADTPRDDDHDLAAAALITEAEATSETPFDTEAEATTEETDAGKTEEDTEPLLLEEIPEEESSDTPAESAEEAADTETATAKEDESLEEIMKLLDDESDATDDAPGDAEEDATLDLDGHLIKDAALSGAAGVGAAAALKAAGSFLADEEASENETPETQTDTEQEELLELLDIDTPEETKDAEEKPTEPSEEPAQLDEEIARLLETDETDQASETPADAAEERIMLDDEIAQLLETAEEKKEAIEGATTEAEPLGLIDQPGSETPESDSDETIPLGLVDQPASDAESTSASDEEAPLELFELAETPAETDTAPTEEKEDADAVELFDLAAPAAAAAATAAVALSDDEAETPSDHEAAGEAPLPKAAGIAYEQNAELIGITTGEYLTFLSQFVEESYGFEESLRGQDLREFRSSLASLKDASQLLHLPQLTDQLRKLENATSDEKQEITDTYYAMIGQIRDDLKAYEAQHPLEPVSAERSDQAAETPAGSVEAEAPLSLQPEAPEIETPETPITESEAPLSLQPEEPETPQTDAQPAASGMMSMQEVAALIDKTTPLPFDFSTNVAAEELGLPEELVGEFVDDFIAQARENIPVLLSAHQKGDMETVQSTAHLLKGAASNLRIDPLAKTLETMQFNEDPDKVPELFDRFVSQLKALENLIHPHGLN